MNGTWKSVTRIPVPRKPVAGQPATGGTKGGKTAERRKASFGSGDPASLARESGREAELPGEPAGEEQWKAILRNDAAWNGRFFYAVRSTGIYCRPSCGSRVPRRENVRIFRTAEEAEGSGFRPCKRCKPHRDRLPDREWVEEIKSFIGRHCQEPLTLGAIAAACHGSPYHLHRTFKRVEGVTPADYLRSCRLARAAGELRQSGRSVAEIGARVGYPNPATFAAHFKRETGFSPSEYRRGSSGALCLKDKLPDDGHAVMEDITIERKIDSAKNVEGRG